MKIIEESKSDKKENLERLLEHGTVMIFIDSRRSEVQVPQEYKNNAQLPLNLDYAYQIPDFKIWDDRVEVSLEFFNSSDFFCVMPFEAIYAMRSESVSELVVFPESVPVELILQKAHEPLKNQSKSNPKQNEKPHLVAIETPQNLDKSDNPKKKKDSKKTDKKNPHLKLVK